MYQPGAIRKIEVKNFVTYSYVELYPGPKLNMIIGPNGTGKSTVVAAIILGLGGNPKTVGRGTKVSEYVKHDCESAVINIYLQDEQDNKFVKVTREFTTRDKTTWKLNNKTVKSDQVQQFIKKFNIQVDNLCQFLPQDRVQDFAKMNKQDLLKETQKALCRFDLIDKQESLIKSKDEHTQLQEAISRCQQKLQECNDLNSRLEGRVQSFNKKKEYLEKIQNVERKIAWTMFESKKHQLSIVKKDRNKAQEVYNKYKDDMKPTEKELSEKKRTITDLQRNNIKVTQNLHTAESSITKHLEKIDSVKESVEKVNDEIEAQLAQIEQLENEIGNVANKLEEMKIKEAEEHTKVSASERLRQTLSTEMTKLSKLSETIQDKKYTILQNKNDNVYRIRSLENESKRLENVKHNRLQYLQKINPDAYQAVNWFRNNKHLFKGEIYEPILLELNVLENRHAKYVENVIPFRDRIAFTCVNKEDMNKLIKSLREGKQLSVNVVHSDSNQSSSQFQPSIAVECLRKYGFYTYMNNLFTAPEPIMNYLCKTYRLHNIPLGDQTTDNCYEDVPKEIRQFFSEKYRYNVSMSKYSGQKSIRQTEVGSDGSLSLSVDVVKMNQLQGQIAEIQRNVSTCDTQIEALDKQFETLKEKITETKDKLKDIQQQKQLAQTMRARVETLTQKKAELEQLKRNPDEIRNEGRRKSAQLIKSIAGIHAVVQKDVAKIIDMEKKNVLFIRNVEEIRKKLAYLENEINEKKRMCQESEETLNHIKDRYNEIMEEAKTMLDKAKGLSKGFTPADDGFDEFRSEYEALSEEIDELSALRERLQSKIACLHVADDGEMKEYEDRLKEIDRLSRELEKQDTEHNKINAKIAKWEEEWLVPLKQLIAEINVNFASAFERLGCAGEVSVCTGGNDGNFSQYGISIKVTYRNGEPLQELNSNVQSGGERAVATAAYMLSLQQLTPVPFRCVDEINQGMDANNERRIFELVVDTTCRRSNSQYFLITPKLIKQLGYSQEMNIHIVHNAPFVAEDKKWGFSNLCNPHELQIA